MTSGGFEEAWADIFNIVDDGARQGMQDDDNASMGSIGSEDAGEFLDVPHHPPQPSSATASGSTQPQPSPPPPPTASDTDTFDHISDVPHAQFGVSLDSITLDSAGDIRCTTSKRPIGRLYTSLGKRWKCKCLLHRNHGDPECMCDGQLSGIFPIDALVSEPGKIELLVKDTF